MHTTSSGLSNGALFSATVLALSYFIFVPAGIDGYVHIGVPSPPPPPPAAPPSSCVPSPPLPPPSPPGTPTLQNCPTLIPSDCAWSSSVIIFVKGPGLSSVPSSLSLLHPATPSSVSTSTPNWSGIFGNLLHGNWSSLTVLLPCLL